MFEILAMEGSETGETSQPPTPTPVKLTDAQLARIERNRQHALLRRQERLAKANHPYFNPEECVTRVGESKLIDSGGGFFIEESELKAGSRQAVKPYHPPAPDIYPEIHKCLECEKTFVESYLYTKFDLVVCDECRNEEDKHSLITKTEAKTEFLLKDVDIEQREPLLKFIVRKNPYNSNWGSMKLFLRCQIEKRAFEVWGSEEEIEAQKEKRVENREKLNQKRFNKKIKELRMAVRSSTYTKDLSGHTHSYGEEKYNEEEDVYEKSCTSCGQVLSYEKM